MTRRGDIATLEAERIGMKVVTAGQMRDIDRKCILGGTPEWVLMENAGKAVAEETIKILGGLKQQEFLVLVGAGNNGGDGLVAARYLHDRGAKVNIYPCSRRPAGDTNLEMVRERGISCLAADAGLTGLDRILSSATCVIDALLGTGKTKPLEGVFQWVLQRVGKAKSDNRKLRIVALDLPSGLDADNGRADPACLYADDTVTLAFPKLGFYSFPGAAHTGKVTVADIGIPASLAEDVKIDLMTPEWAKRVLPPRPLNANKGTFGKVLVIGGSANYIGAVCLAGSGAYRVGAGLVTLAAPAGLQSTLAACLTEATHLPLPETGPGVISPQAVDMVAGETGNYNSLLIGCGMGRGGPIPEFMRRIIESIRSPVVIDADGLNNLAKIEGWWQKLPDGAILTPHPGEFSRLSGLSVEEIEADRTAIVTRLAQEWGKIVVLKGAHTVIAAPDGRCRINPAANPGLSSAGTGDVLAGAIAGLAAQGLSPFDAASLGVYLHGVAGEMVRESLGDAGMTASDLLPALPRAIRKLKNGDEAGRNAAGN